MCKLFIDVHCDEYVIIFFFFEKLNLVSTVLYWLSGGGGRL